MVFTTSSSPENPPAGLTRRRLLARGGSALGALALTRAGAPLAQAWAARGTAQRVNSFGSVPAAASPVLHSRPDLRIPGLAVDLQKPGTAPGQIFFGPFGAPRGQAGAIITDQTGAPVWEYPTPGEEVYNFQAQTYRGQPALTWWQGKILDGHGVGGYVIANQAYQQIARVQAGNGLQGDLHEFLLTSAGTALLTAYRSTHVDLRSVGGSRNGMVEDAIFQEVDLGSGRVLLEWHSLDHIPLSESYWPLTTWSWDYVHLNSIDLDTDGQLLVSSRNTHTIYKIDRRSGEIVWRLGGKHSDFAMGPGASFAWQHDARRPDSSTITLFDNEGAPGGGPQSRAVVLAVDEQRRTARLVRQYLHPQALQASSCGSVRVLPGGNLFVCWGAEPFLSEYSAGGELLFDARLGAGYSGYRAFRIPWSASGQGLPSIAAQPSGAGASQLWVSWNGDTEVARWLVLAGASARALKPLGTHPRDGFETAISLPGRPAHVAVRGLDAHGRTLGQSPTIAV